MSSRIRTLLLLLILVAFGWRVHGLSNQSLWRDEVDAIYFATRHLPETLSMFVQAGQNGPLFFVALRPWFSLAGTGEFALRFVSALAGTASVALLWQVARLIAPPKRNDRLPDDDAGDMPLPADDSGDTPVPAMTPPDAMYLVPGLAAAFLAVNPYQLWYSQEGKMYTVVTAPGSAGDVVLLARHHGGRLAALAGLPVDGHCGALYAPAANSALPASLALVYDRLAVEPTTLAGLRAGNGRADPALCAHGVVAVGPADRAAADDGFQLHAAARDAARPAIQPQPRLYARPCPRVGWRRSSFWAQRASSWGPAKSTADACVRMDDWGAALSPWRRYGLLITWLLFPVLLIYALSLRQPIFTDRYVIWIAPAAMIFIALGVQAVWRHAGAVPRYLAAGLAVYVLVLLGVRRLAAEDAAHEVRSAQRRSLRQRTTRAGFIADSADSALGIRYALLQQRVWSAPLHRQRGSDGQVGAGVMDQQRLGR